MEELLAYALLMTEGIVSWGEYQDRLHTLFLEHPTDELLLELECETTGKGTLISIQRYFNYGCTVFDRAAFGTILMKRLGREYEQCSDIREFSTKMYFLWRNLPEAVQFEKPFWALSYADDCLSYGDEGQTRTLYEEAFRFYQKTNKKSPPHPTVGSEDLIFAAIKPDSHGS